MKRNRTLRGLIFLAVRFTTFQIFFLLVISAMATATTITTYGQTVLDEVISINAESKKIKHILLEIEKSVKIKFSYNPQSIAVDQKISIDYRNKKLADILDGIFRPLNVEYQLSGNYIILKKQSTQIEKTGSITTPEGATSVAEVVNIISGKVVDEDDSPLPGVNVTLKNTLIGTSTDA